MLETGEEPAAIVEQQGPEADLGYRRARAASSFEIIAANPDQVESYRKNPKALGWFVGQVMQATQGQANPQLVNEVLKRKLEG